MRVLVVGATGNIGSELVQKLRAPENAEKFDVVTAARANTDVILDITCDESVKNLSKQLPDGVDSVIICCGASQFGPITSFDAAKWASNCHSKLIAVSRLVVMLVNQEGGCAGVLRDDGNICITAGQASSSRFFDTVVCFVSTSKACKTTPLLQFTLRMLTSDWHACSHVHDHQTGYP